MSVQTEVAKYGSGIGYIYLVDAQGRIYSNIPNTKEGKQSVDALVTASSPISSEIVASSTVVVSSGAGTITNLAYGGVSAFNTGTPVTGASLLDLATNLTSAINAHVSSPEYTAIQDGTTVYVYAPAGTGSTLNGTLSAVATTGGLVVTATDLEGGTSTSDEIDNITGFKVYINATSSAVEGTISGATDITSAVIRRPANASYQIVDYTISSGVISVNRKSALTKIRVETEGMVGADTLTSIVANGFNNGDTLFITGVDGARVTTIQEGGNVELANNENFATGDVDNSIELYYNNGTWYEVNRSPGVSTTVASFRANSIPQPASGTTTTALTAGGGTINLTPGTSKGYQILTGSVTLSSSWTIQGAGTPIDGDTFYVDYRGTITASGNSITIFGISLTDTQILEGDSLVKATYDSTLGSYRAVIVKNVSGEDLVDTTQLATKEDSLGNPATDGYVLSSTTGGTRSWVANGSSYFDSSLATIYNPGASGVEAIMLTKTIAAGTLASAGDFLRYRYSGTFLGAAPTYKTLRLRWNGIAGTVLVVNSATNPASVDWEIEVDIVRISNTIAKVSAKLLTDVGAIDLNQTTISGLDLEINAYTLDLTAQTDTVGSVMSLEHCTAAKFIQ